MGRHSGVRSLVLFLVLLLATSSAVFAQQVGAIVGELMSTGRPWTGEIRAVSPSGRHFDILLSAALVTDEQRQPTGIVGALLEGGEGTQEAVGHVRMSQP